MRNLKSRMQPAYCCHLDVNADIIHASAMLDFLVIRKKFHPTHQHFDIRALFTVVVREMEHAEKVIIDTLLLKGVDSPP